MQPDGNGKGMEILLAEDDAKTAAYVGSGLTGDGHRVEVVTNGLDALAAARRTTFDLFILDRMMPGLDGLSVMSTLREEGVRQPVLFLTAMGDVEDRVAGLSAGGDDYLVKPFHISELLARVSALGRRQRAVEDVTRLVVHDLELDLLSRTATRAGVTIELQTKEFNLLEFLMRNAGQTVTRKMILEGVWHYDFDPKTSVVETHMSRLRSKIDKPFGEPLIHTTRNAGYSLHGPQ